MTQRSVDTIRIELDGTSLAATRRRRSSEDEDAPTVLLLHGWPGSRHDFDAVIDTLPTESGDLVAPDLPGFGDTTIDPSDIDPSTYRRLVRDAVHGLLDAVDARSVLAVGYDLGASIAQELARSDSRVHALVLGAPVYAGIGERRFEPAVQAELWYQQLHRQPWTPALVSHDRATVDIYLRHFYTHWWGTGRVDDTHFSQVVNTYSRPRAFEDSITWYRAPTHGTTPAASPAPALIGQPATVLWGERDPVNPPRFADRLGEYFTDHTLTVLPGCGHFIPLEKPAEMAQAIQHALARLHGVDAVS